MLFKKLSIALIVIITSLSITPVNALNKQVYLGGESTTIQLEYGGVVISGFYDIEQNGHKYNPLNEGFKIGDLIVAINQEPVSSINDLLKQLKDSFSSSNSVNVSFKRGLTTMNLPLKLYGTTNSFKTGIYVKDKLSGVGTMTYYDPSTNQFGALGHLMAETDVLYEKSLQQGKVFYNTVKFIKKSQQLSPGSKIAKEIPITIGDVYKNDSFGVYGRYLENMIKDKELIEIASRSEILAGKAKIYTCIKGDIVNSYDIEILDFKNQTRKDIKGIHFKITDEYLLTATNGIVQGMSGSPIVQNGKLIGCVTHVDVNHVDQGYGLYIDFMIQ